MISRTVLLPAAMPPPSSSSTGRRPPGARGSRRPELRSSNISNSVWKRRWTPSMSVVILRVTAIRARRQFSTARAWPRPRDAPMARASLPARRARVRVRRPSLTQRLVRCAGAVQSAAGLPRRERVWQRLGRRSSRPNPSGMLTRCCLPRSTRASRNGAGPDRCPPGRTGAGAGLIGAVGARAAAAPPRHVLLEALDVGAGRVAGAAHALDDLSTGRRARNSHILSPCMALLEDQAHCNACART